MIKLIYFHFIFKNFKIKNVLINYYLGTIKTNIIHIIKGLALRNTLSIPNYNLYLLSLKYKIPARVLVNYL